MSHSAPTVLLVEDDRDTRHIYTLMLREHGFNVFEAPDGRSGVRLARELRPDVIVMNLVLPHVDGLSAAELIRSDPASASIPIIACTAFVREDGLEMALDAGCDSYLEKPCAPSRVVEEVRKYTEGLGIRIGQTT